jgi:hypothetical protein
VPKAAIRAIAMREKRAPGCGCSLLLSMRWGSDAQAKPPRRVTPVGEPQPRDGRTQAWLLFAAGER